MENFSLLQWLNFINSDSYTLDIGINDIRKIIDGVTTYQSSDFENNDFFYIYDSLNSDSFVFTASNFDNQDLFKIYDKVKNGNDSYNDSNFDNQDCFNIYNAISGTPAFDARTTAYLTANGIPNNSTVFYAATPQEITGAGIWTAVNNAVLTINTGANIWGSAKAIYPFTGGTVSAHRYNLVDPTTFIMTAFGTMTQSGTGSLPNGINGYWDTGVLPSVDLGLNDSWMGIYCRTNTGDNIDLGARDIATPAGYIRNIAKLAGTGRYDTITNAATTADVPQADGLGWRFAKREDANTVTLWDETGKTATRTPASTVRPTRNVFVHCTSYDPAYNIFYSDRELSCVAIGSGTLTDSDAQILANAISTLQTELFRNV